MSKFCFGCNRELDISAFGINKSKPNGLQSQCKECRNKYASVHYKRNKQYYVDKAREHKEQVRLAFQALKSELRCQRCGYDEHPAALDFHHVDSNKDINISNAALHGWSLERIKKEILKCVVLCSNCHRIIHSDCGWEGAVSSVAS